MVGSRTIFTKNKRFLCGTRDDSAFENLSKGIEHIDVKTYATDACDSYNLINPKNYIICKFNTSDEI